ncbi:subunit Tom70 of mitochondrial import receptor [Mitosporidium daphniae]|uniref:Subunit Tom70 of mitochondrial import receptor n=1 Tax=Mitosporidium daphniae TaxID=1485682 RepID=A0A098VRF0_9MICR|nr:subunit Tom70 of mitochondrial import receptor [Mitosporidium daphniae]KGG50306.1 subunit Tom70 of mitochondrial import receptor [Mitosporidium daphniae]|eukprot:XP_013236733.1 subunit Tom70 of mitochondrial import receptor [Mitosporidium daphniae]
MSFPHTSTSPWLSSKVVISTAAFVGILAGGYFYYKKHHPSKCDQPSSSSSRCTLFACETLTDCLNAASVKVSSLFKPGQREAVQCASLHETGSQKCDLAFAKEKKVLGNKFFSEGKMAEAIDCYSESISNLPDGSYELSICYCNRAACYLSQGNYQKVVEDCTVAIRCSPLYLKAYERRSRAYESLGQLEDALSDLTACCVIDGFSNQSFPQRLEKILRSLSHTLATELSQGLPRCIFSPFILVAPEKKDADSLVGSLNRAKKMISDGCCVEAFTLLTEISASKAAVSPEMCDEISFYLSALLFLKGCLDESLFYYNKISTDRLPIAHVIRSSILLERSLLVEGKEEIEKAIATAAIAGANPSNQTLAYLYYHLGECDAALGNALASIAAYNKAIKIAPGVIQFYIHKSRASIATGNITDAESAIQEALSRFPGNPEVLNAYGEFLILKATSSSPMEMPNNANIFDVAQKTLTDALSVCAAQGKEPMPSIFLNLAILTLYISNGNAAPSSANSENELKELRQQAVAFLRRAIEIDPLYDAAHIQLAHILIANGENSEAIEHFDKAIESCRSYQDIAQILSLKLASKAQMQACAGNPDLEAKIR